MSGDGESGEPGEATWLQITSPCNGSLTRHAWPCWSAGDAQGGGGTQASVSRWQGFCSCCKRPLAIERAEPPKRRRLDGEGKFAFVVVLWGQNPEYLLGAMVLGYSLRRSKTRHSLVALHTKDVPAAAAELLRRAGWTPQEVDYVEACEELFQAYTIGSRFHNVFTKLRALGLTDYTQIALLDADLLVRRNIDDLFGLPAPAAMVRGPWSGYRHGDRVAGRFFFGGGNPGGEWSWGQSSGINAGVMLLQPSTEVMEQCLTEVKDAHHPEHVRGNGPEQDYLSRFFAAEWTHIGVEYNFQLHQMYFTLSPAVFASADRTEFFTKPEGIRVIHYSSEPKPWARRLHPEEYVGWSEEDCMKQLQKHFRGYRAWVERDASALELEAWRSWQFGLDPAGNIRRILPPADAAAGAQAVDVPNGSAPVAGQQGDATQPENGASTAKVDDLPKATVPAAGEAPDATRPANGTCTKKVDDLPKATVPAAGQVPDATRPANGTCTKKVDDVPNGKTPTSEHRPDVAQPANGTCAKEAAAEGAVAAAGSEGGAADPQPLAPHVLSDGRVLGEVLEVPEYAIKGAEEVTRMSLREWDEAYSELCVELGISDLAQAAVASFKPPAGSEAPVKDEDVPAKYGWCNKDGWWFERRPTAVRVVATSGMLPRPHVTLAIGGEVVLATSAEGIHVAAVGSAARPEPASFDQGSPEESIAAWADAVPPEATVLLAVLDPQLQMEGVLQILAKAALGCPAVPLPPGCCVAAAVGRKGAKWSSTHAAPDVAFASGAGCSEG